MPTRDAVSTSLGVAISTSAVAGFAGSLQMLNQDIHGVESCKGGYCPSQLVVYDAGNLILLLS